MVVVGYVFFFAAVLLGSTLLLAMLLKQDWHRFLAAVRGDMLDAKVEPKSINFRLRPQPILQPVTISICRI